MPLTTVEGTPQGDAPPPPPQRATPARKGARCGAGDWSPRLHRPHPGHTGRGTPTYRPRGRAAGAGTAPDTRHPSQRWQATPPGDGPQPPPQYAAPTGHAGQGDSAGPPHPHTRAQSTWVADPDSLPRGTHPGHLGRRTPAARPRGRVTGGGTALRDSRRPSQRWQATRERRPPTSPAAHIPHRACKLRGQCWAPTPAQPHPRHSGGPRQPAWRVGGRGGGRLTSDTPHDGERCPPPGTPFRHPHSAQRRPARAHAMGPVLGPHARTNCTRDTRAAEPRLLAPEDE